MKKSGLKLWAPKFWCELEAFWNYNCAYRIYRAFAWPNSVTAAVCQTICQ